MQAPVILKSKLSVPKPGRDILSRLQVENKLAGLINYPLSIIVASAGYGKTTALTQAIAQLCVPVGWYTPGPEDDSVYSFASYLVAALEETFPNLTVWYYSNLNENEKFNWKRAFEILLAGIEQLNSGQIGILVVDDWHLVQNIAEIRAFFDRFLLCKPANLHVVLVSRETINLSALAKLRAGGLVLEVNNRELVFSREEIYQLFSQLAPEKLSPGYVNDVYAFTEGWIMAIKLLLNSGDRAALIPHSTYNNLLEYLSQEILNQQSAEIRTFLLKSCLPEFFGYQLCQEVLGFPPSLLDEVIQNELFLTEVKTGLYRYHNLFRDFLYREAERRLPDFAETNARLASFYLRREEKERALGFYIKAGKLGEAGEILVQISRDLVYNGRSQALHNYLNQLPREYSQHPSILISLGDEERLTFNYGSAVRYYRLAEKAFGGANDKQGLSRAYRGLGEIYLDTADPKQAQIFLLKAYRVLDRKNKLEKSVILQLLAENKVNLGKPEQAERYRQLAQKSQLNQSNKNNLEARILLRTGRIQEAIKCLEGQVSLEKALPLVQSSFRETPMLLSICYSLAGQSARAIEQAREVIRIGRGAGLPFYETMGYIRLGHGLLLTGDHGQREECRAAYQRAREMAQNTDVLRALSEIDLGQSLLAGLEGNWAAAESYGLSGIKIAQSVQDSWFNAVLCHVLGIGAAYNRQYSKAKEYFAQAFVGFSRCGDIFGRTLVHWWLSCLGYETNNENEFSFHFHKFLDMATTYDYNFLQDTRTIFGDPGGSKLLLMQKAAQEAGGGLWDRASEIKEKSTGSDNIKIFTLGYFHVIREGVEVPLKEWRRKNALRLFHLFLTKRRSLLNREEIIADLWPDADGSLAERNFKNALYNLSKVLEPWRKPWSSSHYIQRNGSTYYFNLAADFWLDVDAFVTNIEKAKKICRERPEQAQAMLKYALELYQGDYLVGVNLDEWCLEERERLAALYIKAAELLARLELQKGHIEQALYWADLILAKDKYWERAYQLKIWCYKKLNNHVMVNRTFAQCRERLHTEMGIAPSQKTVSIYNKALGKE